MLDQQKHGKVAHSGITRMYRFNNKEIQFARGDQGLVYDTSGSAYTDFVMGYGPVILGHAYPEYNERLMEYLKNGVMMPGYTIFHEEYLEKLLANKEHQHAAIFKTASEAVTAALRMAAMQTGKLGVLRCGFLGWHDAQIGNSISWHEPLDSPYRETLRYTENMRGISRDEPAINWVDLSIESLKAIINTHQSQLGVFVLDAYQAALTSVEVLKEAISICRKAGMVIVADETKTGGRISQYGYAHDHHLDTDLMVFGKSLANGAPLSIVTGNPDLLEYAEKARLSGTFSKEMFAIYSALITFDIMSNPVGKHSNGWTALAEIGKQIASTITQASEVSGTGSLVRGKACLGGAMFELEYTHTVLADRTNRQQLLKCFAEQNILLLEGHPSFVCLAHEQLDLDDLLDRFKMAFQHWQSAKPS